MLTRKVFVAIAFPILISASWGAIAADSFKVSATLSHKGIVFASPIVVVKDRSPASIVVAGEDGYKLAITVTDIGDGKLKITTNLDSSRGSIAPVLVVHVGESSAVRVGDMGISLTAVASDS